MEHFNILGKQIYKLNNDKEQCKEDLKIEAVFLNKKKQENYVEIADISKTMQYVEQGIEDTKYDAACSRERIIELDYNRGTLLLQ